MEDIIVREDVETSIQTLDLLKQGLEGRKIKLIEGIEDDIKEDWKKFEEEVVSLANSVYILFKDLSEDYAGGYIDAGAARSLRLIGEGNLDEITIEIYLNGYKTIMHQFLMIDAHREGLECFEEVGSIYSQFSGNKKDAA